MGEQEKSVEKMVAWENKNVLVTGANGFIGSWITMELLRQGARVVTVMRDVKEKGNLELLGIQKQVSVVPGDIADYETVERAFNEYEVETCFHLAAQAIVVVANRSPLSTLNSNIKGTWNVLEACRNCKTLKSAVVASSDKAYGSQKQLPYTEDSPLNAAYPYDTSKACADMLSRCYAKTYGVPVAVTRCANIYGGADMNFSRIIPDAIRCLLLGKEFEIRSDGTPERDYMYIKDAVSAYLTLAGKAELSGIRGEAFNFGTGKPINVLNLFAKIATACGRSNAKPQVVGKAKHEIDRQYLDSAKAKRLLSWSAAYDLDTGLRETVQWYKEYLKA